MAERTETPGSNDVDAVLFDLLMAVMDSLVVWTDAAGDGVGGLAWRDAVTLRMRGSPAYRPYEQLVEEAARELRLPTAAPAALFEAWHGMRPWPDAGAIAKLTIPFAFITNCSRELADVAARGSGLRPRFVLSAEEAGWFKPDPRVYRQACRRMGVAPARTLMVAGSRYDRDGAERAGLRAVLVMRRPDERPVDPGPLDLPSLASLAERLARERPPTKHVPS